MGCHFWELLLALQLFPTAPMILDVQMCVGWWQWQQNAGDDGDGDGDDDDDGDGDDGCHGPAGHGEGVCYSKELEAVPHDPNRHLKHGCEGSY